VTRFFGSGRPVSYDFYPATGGSRPQRQWIGAVAGLDQVATRMTARNLGGYFGDDFGCHPSGVLGPPERRRLIHHQRPMPPAAMTSSSHGHQVVPDSEAGGGTVGVAVGLAAVLVCALNEVALPVGLREETWLVAVAVAVAVAVLVTVVVAVVVVVVVAVVVVLGAGFVAD
jgi:hypothetical protein